MYVDVPKDYTYGRVTPENFLSVLTGDPAGRLPRGGKVVRSGPRDHVFVYMVDHGMPGSFCFPGDQLLVASQLRAAIERMHRGRRYAKMVFYVDVSNNNNNNSNITIIILQQQEEQLQQQQQQWQQQQQQQQQQQ